MFSADKSGNERLCSFLTTLNAVDVRCRVKISCLSNNGNILLTCFSIPHRTVFSFYGTAASVVGGWSGWMVASKRSFLSTMHLGFTAKTRACMANMYVQLLKVPCDSNFECFIFHPGLQ